MRRGAGRRARAFAALLLVAGVALQPVACQKTPWAARRLREDDSAADATWSSIFGADAAAAPAPEAASAAGFIAAAASTPPLPLPVPSSYRAAFGAVDVVPPAPPPAPAEGFVDGHSYMLTKAQRARGLTYMGSAERLRVALDRAMKTKQLTVAIVGGSISAGAGAEDLPEESWVDRLEAWLKENYQEKMGINVTVNNGAVPGTTSAYACACFRRHVPADADVILLEYAVNDDEKRDPVFNNPARRPFERLLRKLLQMPRRPAVALVNTYAWFRAQPHPGVFWSNTEREYQEFAWYYQLPTVSVKAAAHREMAAGKRGYDVKLPVEVAGLGMRGRAFYFDHIHPDGRTGHRVMAELAMHLFATATRELAANPAGPEDAAFAAEPLPKPMVRDNHASLHDACFVGPVFKEKCVMDAGGWDWVNEAKNLRPKWGYVAREPGKVIKLKLNTTAASGARDKPVLVQLAHLRSYKHMGWAEISCVSGCECAPSRFNGHSEERKSLLVLHRLFATQHPACVLAVEVLPDTDSGEHKVKLAGAIVSDRAGEQSGVDNAGAVEHVHDISFRAKKGVFDIRNHV